MNRTLKYITTNGLFGIAIYFGVTGTQGAENLVKFLVFFASIITGIMALAVYIPNDELEKIIKDGHKPLSVPKAVDLTVGIVQILVFAWAGWFFTAFLGIMIEWFQSIYRNKMEELDT